MEIEEYYEGSGKASAGLKADAEALTLGLAGEGIRITRRVYRFTAYTTPSTNDGSAESVVTPNQAVEE